MEKKMSNLFKPQDISRDEMLKKSFDYLKDEEVPFILLGGTMCCVRGNGAEILEQYQKLTYLLRQSGIEKEMLHELIDDTYEIPDEMVQVLETNGKESVMDKFKEAVGLSE